MKKSQQNDSKTVKNQYHEEIPKERDIYLNKKDRKLLTIGDLWNCILMEYYGILKNNKLVRRYTKSTI